jgi:hypothetical protein
MRVRETPHVPATPPTSLGELRKRVALSGQVVAQRWNRTRAQVSQVELEPMRCTLRTIAGYAAALGAHATLTISTGEHILTLVLNNPADPPPFGTHITIVVSELVEALGTQLIAFATGVTDARLFTRWASGTATPSSDVEDRLHALYKILTGLLTTMHRAAAQEWLLTRQPGLDRTTLEAIRNNRGPELAALVSAVVPLHTEARSTRVVRRGVG